MKKTISFVTVNDCIEDELCLLKLSKSSLDLLLFFNILDDYTGVDEDDLFFDPYLEE